MIGPLISGAIGLATQFLQGRAKRQLAKAEADAHSVVAHADAEAKIKETAATSVSDWERVMASATGESWKDELWTVLFVVIILACFVPWTQPYVERGFAALDNTPAWFQAAIGVSIAASFGVRGWNDIKSRPGRAKE